jgi:nucleotide-binding universal stress UspA family protein
MELKTALVIVDADCTEQDVRSLLSGLGPGDVHVSLVVANLTPTIPAMTYAEATYGAVVFPEDWRDRFRVESQAIADLANDLEKVLQDLGVPGDVTTVFRDAPSLEFDLAAHAAVSDLAFLCPKLVQSKPVLRSAIHAILFESPIGCLCNSGNIAASLAARRVLVAWDGSLSCCRAVHQALPILVAAETVTVTLFDPIESDQQAGETPGSEVAAWLSRHGAKVEIAQLPTGGRPVADCIAAHAAETGADLVVMGAYGHSRFRQMMFGGTTQTMITQTDLPVLFAH